MSFARDPYTFFRVVLSASLLGSAATSHAADVLLPPPSNPSSQNVAANVPSQGNVWTGLAQSVTAVDTNVSFGFYLAGLSSSQLTYTLYSGDGTSGSILKQVNVAGPASGFTPVLVAADFSDINLSVGQRYTFGVSVLGGGLPALGQYSAATAAYAGSNNPYSDGRFYFTGSNYNLSLPAFADRDLAFSMTTVMRSAVPEPGTWAMMIVGFGAIGFSIRRSRQLRMSDVTA